MDNDNDFSRLSGATSLACIGINAHVVNIEVDIIRGLPNVTIVGLPDSTIRESKERIRSAIENSGFDFPPRNYIINLAPADTRKQGTALDLPIAMALLHSTGQIQCDPRSIPMVGELSLEGTVKGVKGVIAMALNLAGMKHPSMIVPFANRHEAGSLKEIKIFPVKTIKETIEVLNGLSTPFTCSDKNTRPRLTLPDFAEVRGQESAKRAIEIAAAGHHNIILYGSPGSGKTMLARRIPSILPPLSRKEALEVTMIHSVTGILGQEGSLIWEPPFRSPHHTCSDSALVGGGQIPSAGEVSLAHRGVLFLDEFTEFRPNAIEALRQPLEDREICVSRAAGTFMFPADFILVAASNPCKCGYLFDKENRCRCTAGTLKRYVQRLSGPVMDRVDIEVLVNPVPCKDLLAREKQNESSVSIRERVQKARDIQKKRLTNSRAVWNAHMSPLEIKKFCPLSPSCEEILQKAMRRINLSARSFFKVIKVARTIADLEGTSQIENRHVLEALSYKGIHDRIKNLD